MFREFLGFDENEKPILGEAVMSVEELHRIKQEARDEMYARLDAGKVTRQQLQDEVSFLGDEWRKNFDKIRIVEPSGKTYSPSNVSSTDFSRSYF